MALVLIMDTIPVLLIMKIAGTVVMMGASEMLCYLVLLKVVIYYFIIEMGYHNSFMLCQRVQLTKPV